MIWILRISVIEHFSVGYIARKGCWGTYVCVCFFFLNRELHFAQQLRICNSTLTKTIDGIRTVSSNQILVRRLGSTRGIVFRHYLRTLLSRTHIGEIRTIGFMVETNSVTIRTRTHYFPVTCYKVHLVCFFYLFVIL